MEKAEEEREKWGEVYAQLQDRMDRDTVGVGNMSECVGVEEED